MLVSTNLIVNKLEMQTEDLSKFGGGGREKGSLSWVEIATQNWWHWPSTPSTIPFRFLPSFNPSLPPPPTALSHLQSHPPGRTSPWEEGRVSFSRSEAGAQPRERKPRWWFLRSDPRAGCGPHCPSQLSWEVRAVPTAEGCAFSLHRGVLGVLAAPPQL